MLLFGFWSWSVCSEVRHLFDYDCARTSLCDVYATCDWMWFNVTEAMMIFLIPITVANSHSLDTLWFVIVLEKNLFVLHKVEILLRRKNCRWIEKVIFSRWEVFVLVSWSVGIYRRLDNGIFSSMQVSCNSQFLLLILSQGSLALSVLHRNKYFSTCFLCCESFPRPINPPSPIRSVGARSPPALPAHRAAQRLQPHGEAGGQRLPSSHRAVLLHPNAGHGCGTHGRNES